MDTMMMILKGKGKVEDFAVEAITPTIANGRRFTKIQAVSQENAVEFDAKWADVTTLLAAPKKGRLAALSVAIEKDAGLFNRIDNYPAALLTLKQGNLISEFKFVIDDTKLTPEQKGLLAQKIFWENQNLAEMREFVNSFRSAISGGF